jgi:L-methionine (R)-S-oxide reductase
LLGVLDIDSPLKDRFDDEERRFLERFAALVSEAI